MYYFILANTESFVGDEYIPEVGLEIVLYLLDAGEPSTVRAHQAHAHTVYITMIMLTVSKKIFCCCCILPITMFYRSKK